MLAVNSIKCKQLDDGSIIICLYHDTSPMVDGCVQNYQLYKLRYDTAIVAVVQLHVEWC